MSGSILGGVDASIPLQAGRNVTPAENPLQMLGNVANTANSINQLRLFPGQMQLQQQAVQGGQVSLAQRINQAGYESLAPLLAMPAGGITHSAFTTALGSAEANLGLPMNGILNDVMATAPDGDGPAFDAKIRALIASRAQTAPESAVGEVTPRTGPIVSTGQTQIPTTVAPAGLPNAGQISSYGATVPQYLSPSELAAQVGRPATPQEAAQLGVPAGTQITETMLQRLQSQGAGALAGPAGVIGVNGPVSPAAPPRLPALPLAPAAGASSGAPGPHAIVSALPPTAPAEMAASVDQYNNASTASNSFRQRIFPLEQAAIALQGADTGPGSETVNQIKSFLLAQSPASLAKYLPGVDPDKIANYDEAVKYLANYAMQQPGAAQSDMHLGLAQVANASTHISNLAARNVVENALGLERMQQAAIQQFNDLHSDPQTGQVQSGSGAQWNRYMQQFAASHDPRGFSWDEQSPAQHQQALQNMTTDDKRRLHESLMLARKYNLTGTPGG